MHKLDSAAHYAFNGFIIIARHNGYNHLNEQINQWSKRVFCSQLLVHTQFIEITAEQLVEGMNKHHISMQIAALTLK